MSILHHVLLMFWWYLWNRCSPMWPTIFFTQDLLSCITLKSAMTPTCHHCNLQMYHTTGRPTTVHNKHRRPAWPWYVFLAGQSWVTHKHVKCQHAIPITSPPYTCRYPTYQKQNKIICSPTLCLCHALMSSFTSQHDTHTKSVNDLSEHK